MDHLLLEPLMNIEEISTEVIDLINNDPYEDETNHMESSMSNSFNDSFPNQLISPSVNPWKIDMSHRFPLRRSIINDNIMNDLMIGLINVEDKDMSKESALFDEPLPISSSDLDDEFLFDVPPPLPALVTPVISTSSIPLPENDFLDKKRKQPEDDCDQDEVVWGLPNKKIKVDEINGNFLDNLQAKLDEFRSKQKASKKETATAQCSNNDIKTDDETDSADAYRFRPYQYEQWQEKFDELCKFQRQYGHCNVPRKHNNTMMLWRWVKRQKYQYKLFKEGKQSTLSQERISALENVGITWDCHGSTWSERLAELTQYQQVNGHCNVPSKYPANPQLSTWVKCQRRQYKLFQSGKPSNITLERITALTDLGFIFEPRATLVVAKKKTSAV